MFVNNFKLDINNILIIIYLDIQGVPERSGHLNILGSVKFDKKLPSNNIIIVKSRLRSHTSQRTVQL